MTTRFSLAVIFEGIKYTGKTFPGDNVDHCIAAWQGIPEIQWVHRFASTLDIVPKNWYVKLELRRGTADWNMLLKEFICTFDGETDRQCPTIDRALQVVMRNILHEPIKNHEVEEEKMVKQAMACYKLAIEEGYAEDLNEELRHIEIPETEGERGVQGLEL